MEGSSCFETDPCDAAGLTLPVAEYGHDEGCSVTGGAVYRGTAQPGAGRLVRVRRLLLRPDVGAARRRSPFDAGAGEIGRALSSDRTPSARSRPARTASCSSTDHRGGEILRVVAAD